MKYLTLLLLLTGCAGPGHAPLFYDRQPFPWETAAYAREAGFTK